MTGKLTLADIVDQRAYERERDEFRTRIIALKRLRRVAVGPIVSVTFENRDTMRFQIQEMARAERMLRDEQIAEELATYNPLIPGPGELSATVFVELTSRAQLEEWLPKLVGIERSLELVIGEGEGSEVVRGVPDAAHEQQLTRPELTASVHYVRFRLTPAQIDHFCVAPVILAVNHAFYAEGTRLADGTKRELEGDLRGR